MQSGGDNSNKVSLVYKDGSSAVHFFTWAQMHDLTYGLLKKGDNAKRIRKKKQSDKALQYRKHMISLRKYNRIQ